MSIVIAVEIKGDAEVMRRLEILKKGGLDNETAMKEIGKQLIVYYANDAFASRGRVYGSAWAPLSPQYKKWKEKRYPGRGILQRSSGGGMQGNFFAVTTKNSLIINNRSPHYKYHQSSAPRKTKLPRRKMAGFNGPLRKMIRDIYRDNIERQIASVK